MKSLGFWGAHCKVESHDDGRSEGAARETVGGEGGVDDDEGKDVVSGGGVSARVLCESPVWLSSLM